MLALIVGAAFSVLNLQQITVDLLWTRADAPLIVLLLVAFVLGFIVALLTLLYKLTRLRARLAKSRRKLKDAQAEIRNLRSMPIQDA
ncbi:MAG TPA: LapA family protein [Salinisphaeraceae bacterium]|nr:LapA family protein [Salinisphaeraceae bacterium]